jgi:translocation and assembly module TamB
VRGTLARPAVFGEITFEPGGRVIYGGNTYIVDRAAVNFANPSRIEPLLDVVARTRVSEYSVTLNLSGSLARLNTTFASEPPLPDLDVLGLLATGAPVERPALSEALAGAGAPGGESSMAAGALLYGQAAALLTARVGKLFGFDQVRVQPLTSGDAVSAARVTVGKRVSRQLYVTYSYDPSSTEQQILQAEWRLSDRLVLVLTQNGNESYAVDARWESRF